MTHQTQQPRVMTGDIVYETRFHVEAAHFHMQDQGIGSSMGYYKYQLLAHCMVPTVSIVLVSH